MYTWQILGPEEALFGHKGLPSPRGMLPLVLLGIIHLI